MWLLQNENKRNNEIAIGFYKGWINGFSLTFDFQLRSNWTYFVLPEELFNQYHRWDWHLLLNFSLQKADNS